MAKFHQQVKTVLSDIETFLNGSVKDKQLSRQAQTQKASILSQLAELREEYPQLASSVTDDVKTADVPAARVAIDSDDEQNIYEDTEEYNKERIQEDISKKDLPASDETRLTKNGALRIRKDKKPNFLSKLSKRPWCVLRGKEFYIYDKKTSKKPAEVFIIEGYTANSLEDASKKDYSFELTCEGKKPYIFEASSTDELNGWLKHFPAAPELRQRPDTVQEGYYVEDNQNRISELLYEDATVASQITQGTPPPLPTSAGKGGRRTAPVVPGSSDSSPSPSGESINPGGDQELYDGTVLPPVLPSRGGAPQEVTLQDDQDIYDETTGPDEEFSPQINDTPPQLPSRPEDSAPPPPPKKTPPQTSALAPAAVTQATSADTAAKYYGMWDCAAGQDKELSFRKGDMITILSRKYEDKGWWVGKLHDKVGLVPKNYLRET